jgi:glycosyltransferase involved in cell wall biosynthesis
MAPKVFVGLPTFNRPDMLQGAMRSVAAQSFGDFRAIVSDNCSDGDIPERIERCVAELGDPRFSFYRQPENGGEYGQGRFFLREAQDCEFFVILHDDDVLLPDFLAEAVAALEAAPTAACFVANGYGMTPDGRRDAAVTREHLQVHGRIGAQAGSFDVLTRHMECGFAPISGTLFRREALQRSGFVDADLTGNYPFESNIFLRLGEIGAQGWFSPRELLGVRYHPGSLRNQRLLQDAALIGRCIRLFEKRRFSGKLERRRRVLLSRYRRAQALIRLEEGEFGAARQTLAAALRDNRISMRAWALAPFMMAAPSALRAVLRLRGDR